MSTARPAAALAAAALAVLAVVAPVASPVVPAAAQDATDSATASPPPTATDEPTEEPAGEGDGQSAEEPGQEPGQDGLRVAFELAAPPSWPEPPTGTARSVLAVDADTGQVLAERNADERFEVASAIKLVTALTARRLWPLDHEITAGPEAEIEGSTAAIDPGDTWTVEDLLFGMLLRSGNDAAEVLANADGYDAFIAAMNTTLEDLGLEGATVDEPSGLGDTNFLSARDLVVIGQATLADPVLAEMVAARAGELPSLGVVPNRNLLLERLDNAIGIKTGTTDLAGNTLVGAATLQGRTVVTAVLGTISDEARYDETVELLAWIDDIGVREVPVGAEIRHPGRWAGEQGDLGVWAPTDVAVDTTVAVDGNAATSRLALEGSPLAQVVVDQGGFEPSGDEGVGVPVADTVYEAMRAAVEFGVVAPG